MLYSHSTFYSGEGTVERVAVEGAVEWSRWLWSWCTLTICVINSAHSQQVSQNSFPVPVNPINLIHRSRSGICGDCTMYHATLAIFLPFYCHFLPLFYCHFSTDELPRETPISPRPYPGSSHDYKCSEHGGLAEVVATKSTWKPTYHSLSTVHILLVLTLNLLFTFYSLFLSLYCPFCNSQRNLSYRCYSRASFWWPFHRPFYCSCSSYGIAAHSTATAHSTVHSPVW